MAQAAGRIVIISDTHLGQPGRGASVMRPLWAGATRLIINGDVAEVSDRRYRVAAARAVLELQELCDTDGVDLTLLSGNHDPLLSDQRHVQRADGEVFVTHGDVLDPCISPWTIRRDCLRAIHEDALGRLDPQTRAGYDGRLSAAQFASHIEWDTLARQPDPPRPRWRRKMGKPVQLARVLWYWVTLLLAAARFVRRNASRARFFVFGHIHRAGIWHSNRRVVINTGLFGFPTKPRAVVIQDGTLSVWPVRGDAGTYRFAKRPVARFQLGNQEPGIWDVA